MVQKVKRKKPLSKIGMKPIVKALEAAGGNVTIAAEKLGYHHSSLYNYIKHHEGLQKHLKLIREKVLDMAENQLLRKIRDGDLTAIIFYLKTQGKDRGYVEKLDTPLSGKIEFEISYKDKK